MKRRLLAICLYGITFLCLSATVQAQIKQTARAEQESKDRLYPKTILLGDKGLLLYEMIKIDDIKHFRYQYMDTLLNVVHSSTFKVENGSYSSNLIYSLNHDGSIFYHLAGGQDNPTLVTYNVLENKVSSFSFKMPPKLGAYMFDVGKEYVIFSCLEQSGLGNASSIVIKLNLKTFQTEEFSQVKTSTSISYYHVNDTYAFSFIDPIKKTGEVELYSGNLEKIGNTISFTFTNNRVPEFSLVKIVDQETIIFYGPYIGSKSKFHAAGIFFGKIKNNKLEYFKEISFTDLSNFYSYEGKEKNEKMAQETKEKLQKGKVDFIYDKISFVRDLSNTDSYGFGVSAYVTNSGSYSGLTTYNYQYGLVFSIDQQVNIIFNNSFKMKMLYSTMNPKPNVMAFKSTSNYAHAIFIDGVRFNYTYLTNDEIKEDKGIKIQTKNPSATTTSIESEVSYWYGNNFIIYGKQGLNEGNGGVSKSKEYLFWNKITF